ncbi:MAG TPA: alpha/beta hydrolase [Chthoniobacterales bacterium]|jgi:pimeloyl-ACP methyl ester carboxylesterase|nr:alpha/beta hydrolase [Chthoniobacterales bacterium]
MKLQPHIVQLKAGGHLAYSEYGDGSGTPVLFCHGWPSSRTMAELADAAARELRIRIISPDRPGISASAFVAKRKLLDWPAIVRELMNVLGIGEFHILAISGGAPYAYATGWKFRERVRGIAVASGVPPIADLAHTTGLLPLYRWMLVLYRKHPQLLRTMFYLARPIASLRPPMRFRPLLLRLLQLQPCDAAALRDSAAFEACFESQRRAWRASAKGVMTDAEIYAQPWGFRLEDVDVPVRLWHGTLDRAFSVEIAKEVAKRLPNCAGHYIENEGHYSLPIRHVREILADLIAL